MMQIPLISTLLTTLLPSQLKTPDNALLPYVFDPIPLGSIKPQGWMLDQLQLMADGLAGHQYDFYRFVKDSSWTGGDQEYSTLNEAWPYWFNSIVPLAYALDDTRLKQQVQSSVDYLLEHQFADGWIGPESNVQYRMFWPRTLVLMGLTQYLEAEPGQASRVLPHLYRYMNLTRSMLQDNYLGYLGRPDSKFDYHWGITRSQDMIISLQWLYDYYPEGNEQLLLDIMNLFNEKAWDWAYFYSEEVFPKKDLELFPIPDDPDEDLFWYYHGVNSAMGLKALPVVRRLTHNDTLLETTRRGVNWTFEYHGSPSGTIIGDEPWSGLSPTRGSELCTAVEAMYSLAYNYRAMGDWEFAERAELAAFNALPGGVSSDWWSHQYLTQTNQPYSRDLIETPFNNVNSLGQTFGLEPDYPCCTVNHPQGFPKFLAATYVRVGSDGIGHALLTPSKLTTTLKQNNKVTIDCQTNYPFGNTLTYIITADSPFNFFIRIPQWAILSTSTLKINSNSHQAVKPDYITGMHKVLLPAGMTKVSYTFSAEIRIVPRARDTVAIYHGALLYAIPIAGHAHAAPPRDYRSHELIPEKWTTPLAKDYTINNTSSWNIAIDPTTLKFSTAATGDDFPLPNPIFNWSEEGEGPPTTITGMGCEIEWGLFKGAPADPPLERKCLGGFFEVTMVPYGAAKLHMAELPTVRYEEKDEL